VSRQVRHKRSYEPSRARDGEAALEQAASWCSFPLELRRTAADQRQTGRISADCRKRASSTEDAERTLNRLSQLASRVEMEATGDFQKSGKPRRRRSAKEKNRVRSEDEIPYDPFGLLLAKL
jgi:ferric-dicitrate binding protein FerR (iron transport regulator)